MVAPIGSAKRANSALGAPEASSRTTDPSRSRSAGTRARRRAALLVAGAVASAACAKGSTFSGGDGAGGEADAQAGSGGSGGSATTATTSGAAGGAAAAGGGTSTSSAGGAGGGTSSSGMGGSGVCVDGDQSCVADTPRKCVGGQWVDQAPCVSPAVCGGGVCVGALSCQSGAPGAGADCGASGNGDCCASPLVQGGTFNRGNNVAFPATVSSFRLDTYEVTVGRFRAFVQAGMGTQQNPPAPSSGAHPTAGGGWDPQWNTSLPADGAALLAAIKCPQAATSTWNDVAGAQEHLPMNCINSFEAFAFCAWDGGRLPSETEWEYAAAGGSEQRQYPWGAGIDATRASYACTGDGSPAQQCAFTDILAVGSLPSGAGKWGQVDMSGNLFEFAMDFFFQSFVNPCTDCVNVAPSASRTIRGGGYNSDPIGVAVTNRGPAAVVSKSNAAGVRCARAP